MLPLFLFAVSTQLIFWGYFLQNAYSFTGGKDLPTEVAPAVSIIVCFHNEASLLAQCVQQILHQEYAGRFELILVDDNSTDTSAAVVRPFGLADDRVRLFDPGPTRLGKKDALQYGIGQARYDFLLLTDADCVPASAEWLSRMVAPLTNGAEIALGVSPFFSSQDHSILSNWQRFEGAYVSLKYLGFAQRGFPYMGVGRNLAYRKSFFQKAGGFTAHADLPSGDDDLLVGGVATSATTARVVHPAAWVFTHPQRSWRAYFRQRARHQTTGSYYRKEYQLFLGLLALSHGLTFLLGLYLLFTSYWWVAILMYLLRLPLVIKAFLSSFLSEVPPSQLGATAGAQSAFKRKVSVAIFVTIFDALLGPMYLYLAISTLWPKNDSW